MTLALQAGNFRPERPISEIADFIADPVTPADFPEHRLRFRNDRAARSVGLDLLDDASWVRHFGYFDPLPGAEPKPLALRYHGHQFRVYNPDLGDGRGFLFAQLREKESNGGRLLDLGTKGSGLTPYSRTADGRLTLKGAVREILATEMLEALGVSTSRTFSVIETGEELIRGDEPSPTRSAVLVRLSHGHIRIGSFQRLATLGQTESLRRLADYCLRHLFELEPGPSPELTLFETVMERTADLAASYMVSGFVHGVLNSDNIAITAESFDYGPWRFTPTWEPGFTAAYFDQSGLYCFARQAEAIHWNLAQLARAMEGLVETDLLVAALRRFPALYEERLIERFLARTGHLAETPEDARRFVEASVLALRGSDVPIDQFFFDGRLGDLATVRYPGEQWDAVRSSIERLTPQNGSLDHPYWSDSGPCSMMIGEVEEIWEAISRWDNWEPLMSKISRIRAMGAALATNLSRAVRPIDG